MTDHHICILAAGQSKRMKSKTSKMVHPLCGKPLISHVVAVATELEPRTLGIVVGYQREQIAAALEGKPVDFIVQEEQLGTAHAVSVFLGEHPSLKGNLLVMNGDTPLLRADLLRQLLTLHSLEEADISLLTADVENPAGYGRIMRDRKGFLRRIVEEADAEEPERKIREINAGIYVFNIQKLRRWLPKVKDSNKQKEYYLPDVIGLALQQKGRVAPLKRSAVDILGINTRVELASAAGVLRRRINEQWMLSGVTMHDPERICIDTEVQIGADTILYPNVYLEGTTRIGSDVTIYPNCRITDSYIESGCIIYENSSVDAARLEACVKIGPFARLRPGTVLAKDVRIGNFVELKKTTMGEGSKANHLAYLGDATIGKGVNIGAGTITCNYDGVHKHATVIEDDVFIGSDTQLIAPVKVGRGAYVAAGSSITEDVPAGALGIARARQVNKLNWVAKKGTAEARSHGQRKKKAKSEKRK
jgi:bifunctional UDP-N-acetylglucosamine pyrophosphorylase/glucosamine-1-phosphate N-acetyltransferase